MTAVENTYYTLLADNSLDDLRMVAVALRDYPQFHIVHQAHDGADVIAYLKGEPPYGDRRHFPYPDLLISGLKMPVTDGFKVLEWIRTHQIPPLVIIVYTGSENPDDHAHAKALGADEVCVKPISFNLLREAAGHLENLMAIHRKGRHAEDLCQSAKA